jgi:zinc D-Ala-D-Ala dipeptidase
LRPARRQRKNGIPVLSMRPKSSTGLQLDIRYFGEHNFVGRRIDGYEAPRCLLTREAASALAAVQRDLRLIGLGLKVFDCYRPARAVAHFVRWARDASDQARKAEFYPDIDKRNLFKEGYIAARSGPFARFDGRSHARAPERWTGARHGFAVRFFRHALLAGGPERGDRRRRRTGGYWRGDDAAGFRPYNKEWWHFTLANEPFPNTYFDFPVR